VNCKILETTEVYNGEQLKPLWIYLNHGLLGDGLVSWIGPCRVETEHMIDGEDVRAGSKICGDQMVHLIAEIFDFDLAGMVGLQRLASELLIDTLLELRPDAPWGKAERKGDDIFLGGRKFNISIATVSPRSSLMHYAFNVTNSGTPIETSCVEEFGLSARKVQEMWLRKLEQEVRSVRRATWKVRTF
jgi:hypothetical protein